jgi:hypothetical protein
MQMADQPRKAGVYDAPGSTSTSSSQTDTGPGSGTVPTLNSLEGTSTHDKASAQSSAGMFAAIPTWGWIVAVVVVLIILAMILF